MIISIREIEFNLNYNYHKKYILVIIKNFYQTITFNNRKK